MSVGSSSKWLALFQRGAADVSQHSWVIGSYTKCCFPTHSLLTLFAAGIFLSVKASKEENSTCLCVCKEKGICKEVFEICFKD